MIFQKDCKILKKQEIADGVFDFTLYCKEIAENACAGQFVHVTAPGFFLRRPISICGIDKSNETLRIVMQIRGKGTEALSKLESGDEMNVLGPLGHGFTLDENAESVILIGGGIGTPPMLEVSSFYKNKARVITGFRTKSLSILSDDFKNTGADLIECSDDGSIGKKGFVTDALSEQIKLQKPDIIYACGPTVMLKGIRDTAIANGIKCEISMEERMACGVGACLGCAVKLNKGNGEYFGHVCKDGPVFNSEEVVF